MIVVHKVDYARVMHHETLPAGTARAAERVLVIIP
jgi:hypothetical protein